MNCIVKEATGVSNMSSPSESPNAFCTIGSMTALTTKATFRNIIDIGVVFFRVYIKHPYDIGVVYGIEADCILIAALSSRNNANAILPIRLRRIAPFAVIQSYVIFARFVQRQLIAIVEDKSELCKRSRRG